MNFGRIQYVPAASDEAGARAEWGVAAAPAGRWAVTARADVVIKLKRLFPRADERRSGALWLVATREVERDLLWILDRWALEVSDEDVARLRRGAEAHERTERTVGAILAGGTHPIDGALEPAREPREYQRVAADLAIATGRLLLTDELGLGKTMSGLLTLRAPGRLPALVVCQTHVQTQWLGELAKTFPLLRGHIVRSMKVYDPASRRELRGHAPDVLIVPYSKLRGWAQHLRGQVRTVIFDEAQELRRANSEKWKAAAQVADRASLVIGLTNTPIYNYGGEIHNVMSIIAPDALGSRDEFAREWAGGSYWHDKVSVKDPAALGAYLRDHGLMLGRTRADVGRELPEVIRVPHTVDADERVLDEMQGDALRLAEMIVSRAATRTELFRAAGDFDWKLRQATGIAKAPYVADFVRMLLEAGERKVLLFGWHRAVYDIWRERLAEFNPVLYTGSESPTQKDAAKQRFLELDDVDQWGEPRLEPGPEESRVLIMSLRSGAGLDGLQDAVKVGVFGELDWSPKVHDQGIGRYHRDGQTDPCVAYFLVSDHGADPAMAEVLQLKRQQADPIINPDGALFEDAPDASDRIRRLAEDFVAKARRERRAAA